MNKELEAISLLYPNLFEEGVDWDGENLELFDELPKDIQEKLLGNKEFVMSFLYPCFDPYDWNYYRRDFRAHWSGDDEQDSNKTRIVKTICKYFSKDKEVMLEGIARDSEFMAYCDSSLKNDKSFVIAGVAECGWALHEVDGSLADDRDVVIAAVSHWPFLLGQLSEHHRDDKQIVLAAVEAFDIEDNHYKFQDIYEGPLVDASERLKADREIIEAALESTWLWEGSEFSNAADSLKNDKEFVMDLVGKYSELFAEISDELRSDKEVALKAVSKNGAMLQYVSDILKADNDVVIAAVANDGSALTYACEELKANKEIVLAAVQNDGIALTYACEDLQTDSDILRLKNSAE